jgi:hypothetical protein
MKTYALFDSDGNLQWVGSSPAPGCIESNHGNKIRSSYLNQRGEIAFYTDEQMARKQSGEIFGMRWCNIKMLWIDERKDEEIISEIRAKRRQLLAESDWTQLGDSSANKSGWAAYRQALRDITKQADLRNIIWPEPPA